MQELVYWYLLVKIIILKIVILKISKKILLKIVRKSSIRPYRLYTIIQKQEEISM